MTVFAYPATLFPDAPGFRTTFEDFVSGVTHGATRQEALAHAADLLETMVSYRIAKGLDLPRASPARGRPIVRLAPLSAAKAGLYMAMREAGVGKAKLARRLGWTRTSVARLLDLRYHSRMEHVDRALAALGKRLAVEVRDAA